jgi:hypothetical protein
MVRTHSQWQWAQWRWAAVSLGAVWLGLVGVAPGLAQTSNSGDVSVSQASPTATVSGVTAGFFSLANLAMRDHQGHICTGFADTNPDHILTLQDSFEQLTIQVDSGGNDTTLLVQGPSDNIIRCGEDINRRNPDAQIRGQDWSPGTYRIWVGAHDQGQRYNYSLIVSP